LGAVHFKNEGIILADRENLERKGKLVSKSVFEMKKNICGDFRHSLKTMPLGGVINENTPEPVRLKGLEL